MRGIGMQKISDCPICGNPPSLKENYTAVGGHLFSGAVCESCGLAGLHFTTQEGIDMWQDMVAEWHQGKRPDDGDL